MSYYLRRVLTAAAMLAAIQVRAQTAAPVMQPIADIEVTVSVPRRDQGDRQHVYASNSPTQYHAVGLPPAVYFMTETFNDVPAGVFFWQKSLMTGGTYTVHVTASNAAGTSAPATFRWIVHPGMVDFIRTDRRTYYVGDVMTFTATFSAPVFVTGAPYLQLWGEKKAMYVSGSGTTKLKFRYQVTTDDPPLSDQLLRDISPNGGGIATADGTTASLHSSYNGLGDFPTFNIAGPDAPRPTSRLVNLSSRAFVSAGDAGGAFIAGFVVGGNTSKRYLLRAVGPGLAALGIQGPLANPKLQLYDRAGKMIAENDDWSGSDVSAAASQVGAFGLQAGSRDAALLVTLDPGPYTFHVSSAGGGVALAEVYDASGGTDTNDPALVNISSRGYVGTGEGVLIAGFVVTGEAPKRFMIRAVGPGISQFGVNGVLADPELAIYYGSTLVARNDNWETDIGLSVTAADLSAAASSAGAFPLQSGSRDAATLVTLSPASYTVIMSGAGSTTGSGLLEVYAVPDL